MQEYRDCISSARQGGFHTPGNQVYFIEARRAD